MADDLPVPFDPKVHRPARLGYRKAALLDQGAKLVGLLARSVGEGVARSVLR